MTIKEYLEDLDSQIDSAMKHLLIARRLVRRLQASTR